LRKAAAGVVSEAPAERPGLRAGAGEASPGGLRVRVRRVPGPGIVAVRGWLAGGARTEAIPGQAVVAGRALTEGTARRDWRRIADEAEALGAAVGSSASFEAHGVSVDARTAHWREALDWTVELLAEPSFPEDRCRWVARQTAAELESLADQPEVRTAWAFLEQLHAPDRRRLPLQGTAEDLARLGGAECSAFHGEILRQSAVTITVAGDIEEAEVLGHLEALIAPPEAPPPFPAPAPRAEEAAAPALPEPRGLPEARREVALPDGDQAHLYLGCLTIVRAHPDRHALELLAVVLGAGAGLTGRLPERVREREGLAYSVHVQTLAGAGLDPGRLVVYVGTGPATVEQAEASVVEELRRLVAEGVTPAEIADARSYLLGREPFRRETARQWADILGEAILYGVPEDDPEWRREALEALDAREVTEAARRHIDPEALKVTVGVPEAPSP
jgi:zinc protease